MAPTEDIEYNHPNVCLTLSSEFSESMKNRMCQHSQTLVKGVSSFSELKLNAMSSSFGIQRINKSQSHTLFFAGLLLRLEKVSPTAVSLKQKKSENLDHRHISQPVRGLIRH